MSANEFVRQGCSPRVERVRDGIVKEVADAWHIDVGESIQATREVRRVVERPKDAAELWVEHGFRLPPDKNST